MQNLINIKDLFWEFIFFFQNPAFAFKKVTKTNGVIYAAISTPKMPLRFLLNNPEYSEAEVYFKTVDNQLFRIYKYKLQNVFAWEIHCSTDASFGTHIFKNNGLIDLSIEVGHIFSGTADIVIPGKVSEIVLVRETELKWENITESGLKIEESNLVREFYSK